MTRFFKIIIDSREDRKEAGVPASFLSFFDDLKRK